MGKHVDVWGMHSKCLFLKNLGKFFAECLANMHNPRHTLFSGRVKLAYEKGWSLVDSMPGWVSYQTP